MPDHKRYILQPGAQHAIALGRPFGLGRHVNHDPASRRYPFRLAPDRAAAALEPVYHQRHIPIFDQGELGSCTGNAALGILATGPYWDAEPPSWHEYGPLSVTTRIPWTEDGAIMVYTAATRADDFEGEYPPDDTGSDGLSAAKVLVNSGTIPGYQHTFSLPDALAALQHFPLMVGTVWTEAMFEPDAYGLIHLAGAALGGHEWIVDEYVPEGFQSRAGGHPLHESVVGGTTSWGESFGVGGRFYLKMSDFGRLLDADGDVIVLTPPNAEPPVPEPAENADAALAAAMRAWLEAKGL